MANIIDYVLHCGGRSFREKPFCPADAAVLCQLSYSKFEFIAPGLTLLETLSDPGRDRLFEDSRFGDNQRRLYFEASFSSRYQGMKVKEVRSVKDENFDVCFCAMIFEPEGCKPVVVFRGTDEYIVGWKEDFAMAYRCPVPAQTLSVSYLSSVTDRTGDFYICGHSKGGNLAEYSALHSAPELRRRIKTVYNLDGPGFTSSAVISPDSNDRIVKLVPRRSIVGRLLHSDAPVLRVDSEGASLLQHDIFNWKIDESGDFIYLKYHDDAMSQRLNANIDALSPIQLERFGDALFSILKDADIDNLVDLGKHWKKNSQKILSAYIDLDDDTRTLLGDTVAALILG